MKLFKSIGRALAEAVDFVEEKNRNAARLNRIRAVIDSEEQAAEKEYAALGRYFYNNLQDTGNAVTKHHCDNIAIIEKRLDAAIIGLEKQYEERVSAKCVQQEEIEVEDIPHFEKDPMEEIGEDLKGISDNLHDVAKRAADIAGGSFGKAKEVAQETAHKAARLAEESYEGARTVAQKVARVAEGPIQSVKDSVREAAIKVADAVTTPKSEADLQDLIKPADEGENDSIPFE